jgi:hypothetical protein
MQKEFEIETLESISSQQNVNPCERVPESALHVAIDWISQGLIRQPKART